MRRTRQRGSVIPVVLDSATSPISRYGCRDVTGIASKHRDPDDVRHKRVAGGFIESGKHGRHAVEADLTRRRDERQQLRATRRSVEAGFKGGRSVEPRLSGRSRPTHHCQPRITANLGSLPSSDHCHLLTTSPTYARAAAVRATSNTSQVDRWSFTTPTACRYA